jgi:TfoX/Sxy family transcriptional regulator of competence genes
MGTTEDEIRDLAADSLAEMEGIEVRRMFSGWGFYCHGLLFGAAWDREFRFRSRQDGHWLYEAVDADLLHNPDLLVSAARQVVATLELEPLARPREVQGRR